MNISSAASSLYSSSSRNGDQKKSSGGTSDFLAMMSGNALSSLQVETPNLDALPVETKSTIDGLPVEKKSELEAPPVEQRPTIDGLPVEPTDPYVDPQILLTQKLAASLMSGVWGSFDRPMSA